MRNLNSQKLQNLIAYFGDIFFIHFFTVFEKMFNYILTKSSS